MHPDKQNPTLVGLSFFQAWGYENSLQQQTQNRKNKENMYTTNSPVCVCGGWDTCQKPRRILIIFNMYSYPEAKLL